MRLQGRKSPLLCRCSSSAGAVRPQRRPPPRHACAPSAWHVFYVSFRSSFSRPQIQPFHGSRTWLCPMWLTKQRDNDEFSSETHMGPARERDAGLRRVLGKPSLKGVFVIKTQEEDWKEASATPLGFSSPAWCHKACLFYISKEAAFSLKSRSSLVCCGCLYQP